MEITEHQAQINGKDLPISTKQAIEICNFIRGKSTTKAKALLQRVLVMKQANLSLIKRPRSPFKIKILLQWFPIITGIRPW